MKNWIILPLAAVGLFGAGVFAAPEFKDAPADPGMRASYHHKWPAAVDPAAMVATPQPAPAADAVGALRSARASVPQPGVLMVSEGAANPTPVAPIRCRPDC